MATELIRLVTLGRYEYRLEWDEDADTYSIVCADLERRQHTQRHWTDDMPGCAGRPLTLETGHAILDARIRRDAELKR